LKHPWQKRCYLIAEAGVNHNGSLELARQLVISAKECGADAVKFQTFKAERVARADAPKAAYQLRNTDRAESQIDMLRKLELSPKAHRELADLCAKLKIDFLSTPYNEEDVVFLKKLGVPAIKLASIHLFEPHFLRLVARQGLPLFLSTGMGTLSDVDLAVRTIRDAGNPPVVLLHCTTNYPSAVADANLRAITTLRDAFGLEVGYSDHTQSETCSVAAVALGAKVIERHFTLDRSMEGPDHTSAADPVGFTELARRIRETENALGDGVKRPCAAELANMPNMRRSLVARRPIAKGRKISESMLTCKRPADGIAPALIDQVVGLAARRDIREGETIHWSLLG
jgi:N-acetylneuraminate synthase/N,N'-diacetyllegionaminate synthase